MGVLLGILLVQIRSKLPQTCHLICAIVFILTQFIIAAALLDALNYTRCCVATFLAQLFLYLNWSIVADILQVSTHTLFFACFGMDLGISCARYIMNCSMCVYVRVCVCFSVCWELLNSCRSHLYCMASLNCHIVSVCTCLTLSLTSILNCGGWLVPCTGE
jgi:hypothetical protein